MLYFVVIYANKPLYCLSVRVSIKCCKSVQSKENVLFGGLNRLVGFGIHFQRMLFIALLVLYMYLAVRLIETKLLKLPL